MILTDVIDIGFLRPVCFMICHRFIHQRKDRAHVSVKSRVPDVDVATVFAGTIRCSEIDQGNAAYWYNRAGKPVCREPLDAEWLSIVKDLLG